MKKTILIALVALAIGFTACTKPFPHTADAQLLETNPCVVTDIEMEVKIPVGFKVINQAYTDSISAIRTQENPFDMKLLRIFADTILNANISLSDMRHIPYEKTENDLDFYRQTYNANGFWDSVTLTRYHTPDYPKLVVLEMQNSQRTLVRTLFYNNQKAQFCLDYYFATQFYDAFMPFVWSSVASIKPNHELQILVQ
jgi:hypothetical protein